jgi:hypothetical protein
VRDAIADGLERYRDSTARRFVEDVAIPVFTALAILTVDTFQPELIPATAPVLAANCARLVPVIDRMAKAYGVTILCKKARDTAEGLAKRGGKGKGKRGSSGSGPGRVTGGANKGRPDSGRIARDHSDVRSFFENSGNELRYLGTRNVKGRNTKIYGDRDGNRYYEDTVHHHVEAFGKNGTHLGEIDPITRQYCGLADPSKIFKF